MATAAASKVVMIFGMIFSPQSVTGFHLTGRYYSQNMNGKRRIPAVRMKRDVLDERRD
jgi:hypothetical protein